MTTNASQSAPLAIDHNDHDDQQEDLNDDNTPPLDQRILDIVKTCHEKGSNNFVIKPARLSAELGLSVEDANAELCGLLAAVGGGHDGASFTFEHTTGKMSTVMVFTFPPDFEARAKRNRRKEDLKAYLWELFSVFVKALKILTAFGLILSLFILTVVAVIGLVVGIVAMSRAGGNGNHQRNVLIRQLRVLFYTLRQLLWCYALFGQEIEGQDPFLSEMAYDLALLSSICCVNPGGFFWWYRVGQLNRRRRRARRGWNRGLWGLAPSNRNTDSNELETDVEGVRLIRRGDWGESQLQHQQQRQESSSQDEHRGLLSLAVEYLFGPSPFDPGPTEADKWKLRGAAIVQLSAGKESSGVSLQALCPYLDDPPKSRETDVSKILAGGLDIVSHFNGVPVVSSEENEVASTPVAEPHKARFHFPELLAEGQFATRYEASTTTDDSDDGSWESLLCSKSNPNLLGRSTVRTGGESAALPTYLHENRYKFTKLQSQQLFYCVSLGVINLVGVIWFRTSLEPPSGMLQLADGTMLATLVKKGLSPVLFFYARLFFALPAARLVLILFLNAMRKARNNKRKRLVASYIVSV